MEPVPEFICKVCGSTMLPQQAYQVCNHKHSYTGLENNMSVQNTSLRQYIGLADLFGMFVFEDRN